MIGFRDQKAQPVEAKANRSTSWGTGRPADVVRSRKVKNLLFSVEVIPLPVEVRSSTSQGPIEATVTCHALNAPTASEPVDP